MMRYPKNINNKSVIGFVAPSYSPSIEPYKSLFKNALKNLRALGFKFDIGPNVYTAKGIGISNKPDKCAKELMDYYISDKNDCVISVGGGELMCTILEYMDFNKIKESKPKWFMGFSDNTNFTFLLTTLCDVASIYGCNAPDFGMNGWHKSVEDSLDLLCGNIDTVYSYGMYEVDRSDIDDICAPFNVSEKTRLYKYPKGDIYMKGRIIGGCLDCLINICGTTFDRVNEFIDQYHEDGFIWYLDSCDLNIMSNVRAMWQLKNAGWFRYVKGFIIGRPKACMYDKDVIDHREAFMYMIRDLNVPVIIDADLGHINPSMPIINGSMAEVKCKGNKMNIKMYKI